MKVSFLLMLVAASLLGSATAGAFTLQSGYDCWRTKSGSQYVLLVPIEAGHFGTLNGVPSDEIEAGTTILVTGDPLPDDTVTMYCSYPVVNTVAFDMHGANVAADSRHAVSQSTSVAIKVDTIVRRTADASLPGEGSSDTVPTEMIALSLKSVSPLPVTYGTEGVELYDVKVTLDGVQEEGNTSFTLQNAGSNSGTSTANMLKVKYKVAFSHPTRATPDTLKNQSLTFQNTPGTFNMTVVPSVSGSAVSALVAALAGLGVMALLLRRRSNTVSA